MNSPKCVLFGLIAFWSVAGSIFQNSTNSLLNALKTCKTNTHQQSALPATRALAPVNASAFQPLGSAVAGHSMGTWTLSLNLSSSADRLHDHLQASAHG